MNKKRALIVGIDPDVDGSGVAFLDMSIGGEMSVMNLTLSELMNLFKDIRKRIDECPADGPAKRDYMVVVEAGYLNATNWHTAATYKARNAVKAAAETGRRTGRNHQIAKDIVDIARNFFRLNVVERRPLVKTWSGKDRKITHDEFVNLTGCTQKRTNQDQRDAGLLAWYESGLPFRLKIGG